MTSLRFRTDDPELLDSDSVSMEERLEAMRQLPLVNRFLGGARAVLKDLVPIAAEQPNRARLRLLDVGSGSADIPEAIVRWADTAGRPITAIALDRDAASIELAAERATRCADRIHVVRGNALRLPWPDRSFHVVTASMFCHHFFGDELVELVRELTRVAGRAVIINDLHRHWAAYWGFRLASRIFLRGHVVRYDGEVSVRRGFVRKELEALAAHFPEFRWTLRRRFAFRLCLVGRREEP